MTFLDANILIYAHDQGSPHHAVAVEWLRSARHGNHTIALSWSVIVAFVRISTNPAIFARPRTMPEALDAIELFVATTSSTIMDPGPAHLTILRTLLTSAKLGRDLVSDAHLAALAIENDASLCSHDRDFLRFKGLKVVNPFD